jgi:diguanylate cyclase (GGDEF)-like protein/PAS domain S-box-containing protein
MTRPTALPPQHHQHAEWLGPGALLLVLGVVVAGLIWLDHRGIETREADRLQAQAHVIDDNLVRQLEAADSALVGIRDEYLHAPPGGPAAALSGRLKLLASAMPGVRTINILDADGTVVASSRRELVGNSNRHLPYFIVPRRQPNASVLYLSAPFRSTLGAFLVNVGRVLTRPDGTFGGLVVASLDPEYFEVVLRSVIYATDMHTTLVHGDGQVFKTVPEDPAAFGLDLSKPGSVFARHRSGGQVASLLTGPVLATDDDRMVALRGIARAGLRMDKDIVIAVSRDLSAMYEPWRTRALGYGGFYALCVGVTAFSQWVNRRRRRAVEQIAATAMTERQRSVERLQLVADHVPALIAYVDTGLRFRFANRTYRDWLGLDPESLLGRSLQEVFGDTSYNPVRMHFEAALGGVETVYQQEVAMLHGVRYVEAIVVPQLDRGGVVEGLCLLVNDLTNHRKAELELARSEERMSFALEGSGLALFDWDIPSDRVYQSAHAAEMLGWPAVESVSSSAELRATVHPDDLGNVMAHLRETLKGTVPIYRVEFRLKTAAGGWMWLRSRARVVERDANGRALRLAGTNADMTRRRAMEDRLRQMAELDSLTGLPNRSLFLDRLQQALLRAERGHRLIALLFVDVDHFKSVNDTRGHATGDQLLKVFAERMQATVRKSDTVARLGGDEFTVILEDIQDVQDAHALAQKLIERARTPVPLEGGPLSVSASIGVAMSVRGDLDGLALLHRADTALYEAKRRGRDGWCDVDDAAAEAPLQDAG